MTTTTDPHRHAHRASLLRPVEVEILNEQRPKWWPSGAADGSPTWYVLPTDLPQKWEWWDGDDWTTADVDANYTSIMCRPPSKTHPNTAFYAAAKHRLAVEPETDFDSGLDGDEGPPRGVSLMDDLTRDGQQLYAALGEMVPWGWEYTTFVDRPGAEDWPVAGESLRPKYGVIYLCRPTVKP